MVSTDVMEYWKLFSQHSKQLQPTITHSIFTNRCIGVPQPTMSTSSLHRRGSTTQQCQQDSLPVLRRSAQVWRRVWGNAVPLQMSTQRYLLLAVDVVVIVVVVVVVVVIIVVVVLSFIISHSQKTAKQSNK